MPDFRDTMQPFDIRISDEDICAAMKDITGYLDITPGDFKDLYHHACKHALTRIATAIKAGDIMTKQVFSVRPATPLREVAELMGKHGISGLPVVDENKKVVGVISERDFLSRMGDSTTKNFMTLIADCLQNKGCIAISIRAQKAEDIMTAPAISVKGNTTVLDIRKIFRERQINRVPVVDQENVLCGIVTRADILNISFNLDRG